MKNFKIYNDKIGHETIAVSEKVNNPVIYRRGIKFIYTGYTVQAKNREEAINLTYDDMWK